MWPNSVISEFELWVKNQKSTVDTGMEKNAKRLPSVTGIKDLLQPFVIPGGLCVSYPRTAQLKMAQASSLEDIKLWKMRCVWEENLGLWWSSEWHVPRVEEYPGRTDPFHLRHFKNKDTASIQERVSIVEGRWFQAVSFPVWSQLHVKTLASANAHRLWFFRPSNSQGKLASRFLQSSKDWGTCWIGMENGAATLSCPRSGRYTVHSSQNIALPLNWSGVQVRVANIQFWRVRIRCCIWDCMLSRCLQKVVFVLFNLLWKGD